MKPIDLSDQPFFRPITETGHPDALLCLPYAGTGSAIFSGWRDTPLKNAEIIMVTLPGRDARLSQPAIDNIDTLVDQIATALLDSDLRGRTVSILGCSFGALVGFELARQLRRRDHPVHHLVAAASRSPHNTRVTEPIASLPDDEMVERLTTWYAALPPEILENESMRDALLPTVRADMHLYENYRYTDDTPLPCPITAIGASDDPIVTIADLTGWKQHTTAPFTSRQFAGDHFFMRSAFKSPLKLIDRKLGQTNQTPKG